MFPPPPILYNGCMRCDGLFCSLEAFSTHIVACDGNKENSICDFFACPKQAYLKLFSQVIGLKNPVCVPTSNDVLIQRINDRQINIQQQNLLSISQRNSTSLVKPIKIVRIVKTRSKSLYDKTLLNAGEISERLRTINKFTDLVPGQRVTDNQTQPNHEPFGTLDADLDAYPLDDHHQDAVLGREAVLTQEGVLDQETVLARDAVLGQETIQIQGAVLAQEGVLGQETVLDAQEAVLAQETEYTDIQWVAGDKDGQLVYKCKLCPHESSHITFIRRHVTTRHCSKTIQCKQCNFTTVLRSQMHAHQKQHTPHSFLCEHCPLSFKNKSSLTRHTAKKHNGKTNFTCKECDFVAVNSTYLRDHIRKHTGELLYCDQCKFVTKLERALSQHKARHQGVPRFVCDTCGYKTVESGSFRRHVLIHTGQKLFKCPDCSYKATSRYVVVKHIYGKHINFKRYACNKCNFRTAYYSGLSMHLMSHEGIKPYKCSLCSYRSNLSGKIKRHCSQKHAKDVAKVVKVENCLKFDIQDYMNRDVPQVEVKVIRLSDNGAEEEEDDVDEPMIDKPAHPVLEPHIADDGLLCGTRMPVLPPETGDVMEDMSMIEGGFGLCNDPTFPLVNHSYQSEDSNLFIPRGRLDSASSTSNQRLRFSAADTLETDNIMSDLSHTPFKSNPFGGIGLGLRSESWDNLTLIKPHSFGNLGLGLRSESWDNLTQIKPTLFKAFDPRDFLSSMKTADLDTGEQTKDNGEEHSPSANTNTIFHVDPLSISTMDKPFTTSHSARHPEKDKPLCSLLSPEESRPIQLQCLNSSCK